MPAEAEAEAPLKIHSLPPTMLSPLWSYHLAVVDKPVEVVVSRKMSRMAKPAKSVKYAKTRMKVKTE